MTNKTFEQRIVRPAEGFATLAEHALVIVNESNGGKQHRQTVLPGGKAKLPLLGRADLSAYQVMLDNQLRSEFVSKQMHSDHVHSFTLSFSLSFRVLPERPELIVLRFDADPLRKLEEEVKRVLCPQLCAVPWAVIEQENDLTGIVASARSVDDGGNLVLSSERLQSYARSWGLDLRRVEVARFLDEEDVKSARAKAQVKRDSELRTTHIERMRDESREAAAKIDIDRDLEVQRAQAELQVGLAKLPGAWAQGTREAIHGFANSPRSFYEIDQQFRQAMQFADGLRDVRSGYGGNGSPALQSGTAEAPRLLKSKLEGVRGQPNVRSTLAYACDVSEELPCDDEEKRRFLAAMLRLIAATLTDDADLKEVRQQLNELHARYAQEMPDEHSNFVQELGKKS